jgi:hypothetical protein
LDIKVKKKDSDDDLRNTIRLVFREKYGDEEDQEEVDPDSEDDERSD